MAEYPVYTGSWINWSKGSVLGATITTPIGSGNLLVAFLALYVRWAGTHLWEIICFALHQFEATSKTRDALHFQHQAVFKNTLTGSAALARLLRVGWAWRGRSQDAFCRTMFPVLITLFHIVTILVAATFSARVTSVDAANDALVKSPLCGWADGSIIEKWPDWNEKETKLADAFFVTTRESLRKASDYARACYGTNERESALSCAAFASARLASSTETNVSCPFAQNACMTPAMLINSGYLDSDLDLGISGRPSDRLRLRKMVTCAPIPADEGYSETRGNVTIGEYAPIDVIEYHMGSSGNETGYTYSISPYERSFASTPYLLSPFTAYVGLTNSNENSFQPIPDLRRNDADINLMFINSKVVYTGEVKDPVFDGTKPVDDVSQQTLWQSAKVTGAIGCTEQYQFCNGDRCTAPGGIYAFNETSVKALDYNDVQTATFKAIWTALWASRLRHLIIGIGVEVLLAKGKVYTGGDQGRWISTALPSDHWQLEVQNMHNITMAMLQRTIVSHAVPGEGASIPLEPQSYIIQETEPASLKVCASQRIKTMAYSSFSILGLALIISLGSVVILLNMSLPGLVGWIQRRTGKGLYLRQQWIESDFLQLQRMAFEGKGIGPWTGNEDAVPITTRLGTRFKFDGPRSTAESTVLEEGVGSTPLIPYVRLK